MQKWLRNLSEGLKEAGWRVANLSRVSVSGRTMYTSDSIDSTAVTGSYFRRGNSPSFW